MWAAVAVLMLGCGRIGFGSVGDDGGGDIGLDRGMIGSADGFGALAWWKLDEGAGTFADDAVGTADVVYEPGF